MENSQKPLIFICLQLLIGFFIALHFTPISILHPSIVTVSKSQKVLFSPVSFPSLLLGGPGSRDRKVATRRINRD